MKKETRSLLKARAVSMAEDPDQKRDTYTQIEIIEFVLSTENYGVESSFVGEVFQLKEFTPLPGVPAFILGIVNVRGRILPVIDLKKFFSLPEKGLGELNRVIILQDEQMEFGILVDEVIGTKAIFPEELLPVPSSVTGIIEKYIKGVTKERLIILSSGNLLTDKSIVINEKVT
jgi:purine-binding chemotaxis protein CheW